MKFKALFIGTLFSLVSTSVLANEHRGRIQIQGSNPYVEKSYSWAAKTPIKATEGLKQLDKLWNSLTTSQQKERKKAYECAKNFILAAQKTNGINGYIAKTCKDPTAKDKSARIDFEIHSGKAFIK
ncbi:hypothetical protein [Bibersteinia trehalosi]|uniref:hypothetical protein n=1 Tax=Bibersteinia trehalosi TaxID=47735 RepID=UPI004045FA0D